MAAIHLAAANRLFKQAPSKSWSANLRVEFDPGSLQTEVFASKSIQIQRNTIRLVTHIDS
jgi:hypothetical protein